METISNLDKVYEELKKFHVINDEDKQPLELAYQLLCGRHREDSDRINRINHAIAVAEYIASWRFDVYSVMAAMLHDTSLSEDIMHSFANEVYQIITEYQTIRNQLKNIGVSVSGEQETNDHLTYSRAEAFYLVIADRLDELKRYKTMTSEEAANLAQTTRLNLIPQVKRVSAYKIVDILEELCFRIENPGTYQEIAEVSEEIADITGYYREQFFTDLQQIFDSHSNIVDEKLRHIQHYSKKLVIDKRSLISLHRYITRKTGGKENEELGDINKIRNISRTALFDLTWVLSDSIKEDSQLSEIDAFLEYYNSMLMPKGIYLNGYHLTTNQDTGYFLLKDPMKNLYRLFVESETDYLRYYYGNISEDFSNDIDNNNSSNSEEIKVFRKDGKYEYVENGLTVLDYAFHIHEDIGLHFGGAKLNRNDRICPASTPLSNGDTIEIIKNEQITAELNWFRYINSSLAKNKLIKYFKKKWVEQDPNISIIDENQKTVLVPKGSTVLDYAFLVYNNDALNFERALVNNNDTPVSIDYVLSTGDQVVVQRGPSITAELLWFKYLKTEGAINIVISYFRSLGIK